MEVSGPSTSANVVSNLLMLGLPPDLGGERQPSRSLSQQSPWTQVCILGYLQDLTAFDGVFEALQRCGLSLHIHAESPTASALKAEEMFLPTFEQVRDLSTLLMRSFQTRALPHYVFATSATCIGES